MNHAENWSSRVASQAVGKIISEGKNKKKMAEKKKPCDYSSISQSILMIQYRLNDSQTLANKVSDNINKQKKSRQKMETCTPSLKSSFSNELKSKWCTDLNVMGANSSMLTGRPDISPQGLRNNEKRKPQLDSIYGSVVVIVISRSLING